MLLTIHKLVHLCVFLRKEQLMLLREHICFRCWYGTPRRKACNFMTHNSRGKEKNTPLPPFAKSFKYKAEIALIKKCLFTDLKRAWELQECCFHSLILSCFFPLFFSLPKWGSPLNRGKRSGYCLLLSPPLYVSSAPLVYIPLSIFGSLKAPPPLLWSGKHSHLLKHRKKTGPNLFELSIWPVLSPTP